MLIEKSELQAWKIEKECHQQEYKFATKAISYLLVYESFHIPPDPRASDNSVALRMDFSSNVQPEPRLRRTADWPFLALH